MPSSTNHNEDLRALLNAGYRRGAVVARCEGEGKKIRVVHYDAFGAKAIAAIKMLPDTLVDRGIRIPMKRRARSERIERFRFREARDAAAPLRRMLAAWTTLASVEVLRNARPELPEGLDDRAQDGWEPLLAIADMAGTGWPVLARAAAEELHDGGAAADSTGVLLLQHCQAAFEAAGTDRLMTADLLAALVGRDDGPWAVWWAADVDAGRTKGPAARLAALLRPFTIRSEKLWFETKALMGYQRGAFADAWEHYLPSPSLPPTLNSEESEDSRTDAGFGDFQTRKAEGSLPTSKVAQTPGKTRVLPSLPSLPPSGGGEAETNGLEPALLGAVEVLDQPTAGSRVK